jgi:hypothetical protein
MANKPKVPKKIAGVKLSKTLRLGLRDLAASPTGRTALVDALTAAAATAPAPARDAKTTKAKSAKTKPAATKPKISKAKAPKAKAAGAKPRKPAAAAPSPDVTEAPPQATTPPSVSTH